MAEESETLAHIFDDALKLFHEIDNSSEATNSPTFQDKVKKAISMFEDITRKVSVLSMFSTNEDIEEIATEHIRYLVLPALLGILTEKLTIEERVQILNVAEVYYRDYLQRLNDYNVTNIAIPSDQGEHENLPSTGPPDIAQMTRQRDEKMRQYREQKEIEQKLEEMEKRTKNGSADEQAKRECYLTFLKKWSYTSLDALSSLLQERPILSHMQKMRAGGSKEEKNDLPPRQPLKPIIITRDKLQKEVFGAGYPSLATVTIEEFCLQKMQEGSIQMPGPHQPVSLLDKASAGISRESEKEQDDIEKETKVEQDDPEELARARGWDDWKDDNPRGFGNRKNKG